MKYISEKCSLTPILLFLICVVLAGCATKPFEWKEQVKLQSGEIIIVKRTAKQGRSLGELGGPGGWEPSVMTLEIDDDRIGKPPVWRFSFVPMLFDYDVEKNEWFVVATFYTCKPWYDLGRPELPYVEYRARGDKWERVPLSSDLLGRKANLLTGVSSGGEPPLVTLEYKEEKDSRAAKKYKVILDSWHTTC
jgi:hypothetical protein